ncbi:MAG: DUF4395 domain-containing protein [Anaerolineales bacterium]|jgi:hypothetical protein
MAPLSKVDHSALRTNQAMIIGLSLLGYIFDMPVLAGFVGIVMAVGTLVKRPGFGAVYSKLLRPLGLVRPDILEDNPEPHRFAQGFGSVVILTGTITLMLGSDLLGWLLVWFVIALAALNLFAGFCVGCAMYYWLNRMSVPGFVKSPPPGTLPGMRPKTEEK